jgi:hypothetical protein
MWVWSHVVFWADLLHFSSPTTLEVVLIFHILCTVKLRPTLWTALLCSSRKQVAPLTELGKWVCYQSALCVGFTKGCQGGLLSKTRICELEGTGTERLHVHHTLGKNPDSYVNVKFPPRGKSRLQSCGCINKWLGQNGNILSFVSDVQSFPF